MKLRGLCRDKSRQVEADIIVEYGQGFVHEVEDNCFLVLMISEIFLLLLVFESLRYSRVFLLLFPLEGRCFLCTIYGRDIGGCVGLRSRVGTAVWDMGCSLGRLVLSGKAW